MRPESSSGSPSALSRIVCNAELDMQCPLWESGCSWERFQALMKQVHRPGGQLSKFVTLITESVSETEDLTFWAYHPGANWTSKFFKISTVTATASKVAKFIPKQILGPPCFSVFIKQKKMDFVSPYQSPIARQRWKRFTNIKCMKLELAKLL